MEFLSISRNFHRKNLSNEKNQSTIIYPNKLNNDISSIDDYTYRTEFYLQQRDKLNKTSTPLQTSITTWKTLKYRKRILDDDQAEIDRVLSTIDSIHGTFNRSLLIPYSQVYSSLYGDDDKSICLMKTFCQRQDHYYINCDLSMKDNDDDDDDDSNTQEITSSYKHFQDTDLDDETENEEEKENENEKKKSYDSGYGSVMPTRRFLREPLFKFTQTMNTD